MEQLKGLPLGRQLILGAGVLLLIDTFLDWQQVSFLGHWRGLSRPGTGSSGSSCAWPLIVLLVWMVARAFEVELPVNVPDGLTSLGLSALILLFALLKALTDDAFIGPRGSGSSSPQSSGTARGSSSSPSGESLPNMSTGSSSTPAPPADSTPDNDLP